MDQGKKPSSPYGRNDKGLEQDDLKSIKATSRFNDPREGELQVNRAGPPQLLSCRELIYVREGHPLQRIGIQAGVKGPSGAGTTVRTDSESFISEGAGTLNTCRMQGRDGEAPASTRHHQPSSTNRPSTSSAGNVECDFCPAGPFSTHAEMCEHVSQVHVVTTSNAENDTWLICICGKALFDKASLYNHFLTAEHSDEICGVCNEMFRINMVEHQREHFQMYEYKCPRCLDRFKTSDRLMNHYCDCRRVPTYEQPKPGATKSGLNVEGERDSNVNKTYTCGVEGCPMKSGESVKYTNIENIVWSSTILTLSNLNVDARDDSARSMNSCSTSKIASLFTDRNGVHLLRRAKLTLELYFETRKNRKNVPETAACLQQRA